jgi:hypothetical protein
MADGSLWSKLTMGYQLAKYSRQLRRETHVTQSGQRA